MGSMLNSTPGDTPLSLRARIALGVALTLGVILLALTHQGPTGDIPERHPSPPTTTCYEDMPCWDCATMGNHICGKGGDTP